MPRKTYEGTGTLPGLEDPEPEPAARPRERTKPRVTASASRAPRLATWRIVARGFITLVGLLVGLYAFHYLERFLIIDPRFALNGEDATAASAGVEVTGAAHASQRSIQEVFAEDQGRSLYVIPISERRDTLRTVDWVKDASVARLWPNRILVTIEERKPVAFVTLGRSRFGLIDEGGVMLPPAQDRFTLPVLTGVRASDPLTERRDRVHRMLRVTAELGDLAHELSEIDVSDRDDIKVSQPYRGRVLTLLLGDHNFNSRYRNFVNHYEEIQKRLPAATTLDLRLEDRITVVE
ncbi:MAG TPA: FtsQ-type POTRA domain-containing protein [Bryobacteraceae bacterium]|nr:FtsQ-type POTRA domain-containing protein [Bryobacteraceae bacterium]